jgi:hypothetical protein
MGVEDNVLSIEQSRQGLGVEVHGAFTITQQYGFAVHLHNVAP